jgi:hypothetical protein
MILKPSQLGLLERIAAERGNLLTALKSVQAQRESLNLLVAWGYVRITEHPTLMNNSRRRPALALEITPKGLERLAERVHGDESRLNAVIGAKQ